MAPLDADFSTVGHFCRSECRFDRLDSMIDTGDQTGKGVLYFLFLQLHQQAESEWNDSSVLRQQYPTFSFYWYERYERIYNIPSLLKRLFRRSQ